MTGKQITDGWRETGFEVAASLRMSRDGEYGLGDFLGTIHKCTLNNELVGMELRNSMLDFPTLASMVFENDPDDWR